MIQFSSTCEARDLAASRAEMPIGVLLHAIKEDSRQLGELLTCVSVVFDQQPKLEIGLDALVELLYRLRHQLAVHFSLEESFRRYESPLVMEARLHRAAEMLRNQHAELYCRFCYIVHQVDDVNEQNYPAEHKEDLLDQIALDYQSFCDDLDDHESWERLLVTEALSPEATVN